MTSDTVSKIAAIDFCDSFPLLVPKKSMNEALVKERDNYLVHRSNQLSQLFLEAYRK